MSKQKVSFNTDANTERVIETVHSEDIHSHNVHPIRNINDEDTTIESPEMINQFIQRYNAKIDMFDKFLQIYNATHGTTGSMFERINDKDPTDTNDKMELFYEYMTTHSELMAHNPEYIDVYEPGAELPGGTDNDVYALIVGKEAKPKYISLSFISLLMTGVQNPHDVGKIWSVIKL